MSYPIGNAPDGAFVVGGRYGQDLTPAGVNAAIRGKNLGGFINAQGTWDEKFSELALEASTLRDGQLELKDRVDLLDGVRGYGSLFMSRNWNVAQNAYVVLPFDRQLGPMKGVTHRDGTHFFLNDQGLYRADLHVSFAPANQFTAQVYLTVHRSSNSQIYSQTRYDIVVASQGAETAAFSKTFVIPTDDTYAIYAAVVHQRNGRNMVYGGTLRSAFSVNKWDNRIDNAAVADTVPDGGTLG